MRWLTSRTLWGFLLIAGGIVFLLENLRIFQVGGLFWAALLGIGGLGFLSVFLADRQHWWAIIPGVTLLAVATIVFLDTAFPNIPGDWGGTIVLGGIGLAFVLVYLVNQENWWAIIPAGVMVSLAFMTLIDQIFPGIESSGGFFLLGLGLTFALVAILPNPQGSMRWAFIPAGVLLVVGLLVTAALTPLVNYAWPVVLILAGLYLV